MANSSKSDNPFQNANVGERWAYGHPDGMGFGQHARASSGFGELSAEMTEIDLKDGQEVTYLGPDEETSWPMIEWVDGTGINRITTVDPELYADNFQLAEGSR